MWLSKRRTVLAGVVALTLTACGFTPVYGPQGSGGPLQGSIKLNAPETRDNYQFNRRFEERMGHAANPLYDLKVELKTSELGQGATSSGNTTRFRVNGYASYSLSQDKAVLLTGKTSAFTGYSNTGSTVATMAAQRDAYERLMIILADQVIDDLILQADDLPR